jgi:hypothetical protein
MPQSRWNDNFKLGHYQNGGSAQTPVGKEKYGKHGDRKL